MRPFEDYDEGEDCRGYPKPELDTYIILGNGFDLACGLPTRYIDFLNFAKYIMQGFEKNESARKYISETFSPSFWDVLSAKTDATLDRDRKTFHNWLYGNIWYGFFHEKGSLGSGGWLDFEAAIAMLAQAIEVQTGLGGRNPVTLESKVRIDKQEETTRAFLWPGFGLPDERNLSFFEFTITYRELKERLTKDLNNLILAFELYLKEYVERIPINVIPEDVQNLLDQIIPGSRVHILNFNYTHTFETLMARQPNISDYECCHIHGEVRNDITAGRNNMVLGIGDPFGETDALHWNIFPALQKYYQRVYKETDSSYMDWQQDLEISKGLQDERLLLIFGHSLGLADKQVLEPFIVARGMETRCFYYDLDAFAQQVENMAEIIGADKLIMRTGGSQKRIHFQPQQIGTKTNNQEKKA